MVYKVTLDGGLLRDTELLPAVRALQSWASEGKIEIFESDRAKDVKPPVDPWTTPRPTGPNRYRTVKKVDTKGASFQRVSAVLFPMRDAHRLNMTEVNDVAHLIRHHTLGHSMFVTNNTKDFIANGKREQLQNAFKLVVLTPDEAVTVLCKSESWEIPNA